VRFRWKDDADGNQVKVMALEAPEFIRRFLLHVVPERFVRIRPFGLLANRSRRAQLARCRQLLTHRPPPRPMTPTSVHARMLHLTGIDIERCPVCGPGRSGRVEILPPTGIARIPSRATAPAWGCSASAAGTVPPGSRPPVPGPWPPAPAPIATSTRFSSTGSTA
jgi:hypothetical protein